VFDYLTKNLVFCRYKRIWIWVGSDEKI